MVIPVLPFIKTVHEHDPLAVNEPSVYATRKDGLPIGYTFGRMFKFLAPGSALMLLEKLRCVHT